jgi:hypothetical protein
MLQVYALPYSIPNVYYRIHKSYILDPNLSQENLVHNKMHFNIIVQSTLGSSKRHLPSSFPKKNVIYVSHLPR